MTEETLFALALEKPSAEARRAFLDETCRGDRRLRDRMDQLLAADERSRGILEQVPAAVAVLAAFPTDTPVPCGPPDEAALGLASRMIQETAFPEYELIEEVGEGGMGV